MEEGSTGVTRGDGEGETRVETDLLRFVRSTSNRFFEKFTTTTTTLTIVGKLDSRTEHH